MLYSELKTKDVINISDCRKLGRICDMELDACTGCICKITVSSCGRWFRFLELEGDINIPFRDIRQIGPDIILVDIKC